jgi:hypothetical protein
MCRYVVHLIYQISFFFLVELIPCHWPVVHLLLSLVTIEIVADPDEWAQSL